MGHKEYTVRVYDHGSKKWFLNDRLHSSNRYR